MESIITLGAFIIALFILYFAWGMYQKTVLHFAQRDCQHKWKNIRVCSECELRQKEVEDEHKNNVPNSKGESKDSI